MTNQPKVGEVYRPYKQFKDIYVTPKQIMDSDLSHGAKNCFAVLARHEGKTGGCFPSMRTIGKQMNVSSDSAKLYIKELVSGKYILRKRGGRGQSNRYQFIWRESLNDLDREDSPPYDREDSPHKENHAKDKYLDSDSQATHHKERDEQPEPTPIRLPDGWKTLSEFIESILGRSPSQSDILRIVDATPNRRVAEAMNAIYESQRRGYTSDHPKGPRSMKWFVSTVRNYWAEVERCALPPVAKYVMEPDEVNRLASLFDSIPEAA